MHFDIPVMPIAIMSSAQTVQACSHALQHSIRLLHGRRVEAAHALHRR
ncbi:hypothetical protein [Cryobacterium breve]|nr:hypothetical protein [Cryobacterium breve]